VIGLLLALYPAPWRRRYADEFRAVLESRPLGPFDVADVVLGALDARLALRFTETAAAHGGHLVTLRIGGIGALAGGALWVAGMIGANLEREFTALWFGLFMLGTLGLLFALAGLSAFQAHREPRLAWAAFGVPAIGTLLTILGLVGMILSGDAPFVGSWSGWSIWALGLLTTLVGSVLFAVATIRASVLSERAAVALAISALAVLSMAFGIGGGTNTSSGQVLIGLAVFAFGASWMALGATALRRGPIRAIAPA
jgi:hypothetical protein